MRRSHNRAAERMEARSSYRGLPWRYQVLGARCRCLQSSFLQSQHSPPRFLEISSRERAGTRHAPYLSYDEPHWMLPLSRTHRRSSGGVTGFPRTSIGCMSSACDGSACASGAETSSSRLCWSWISKPRHTRLPSVRWSPGFFARKVRTPRGGDEEPATGHAWKDAPMRTRKGEERHGKIRWQRITRADG